MFIAWMESSLRIDYCRQVAARDLQHLSCHIDEQQTFILWTSNNWKLST